MLARRTCEILVIPVLVLAGVLQVHQGSAPVHAAGAPTIAISPTQGPDGTVVSVTADNFPLSDLKTTGFVAFDGNEVVQTTFTECASKAAGFGTGCNNVPVTFQIPQDAAPGKHVVSASDTGQYKGSLGPGTSFEVVAPATPTSTATPTGVPTLTATSPPPTATSTPAPTQSPTDTPSPAPTSVPTTTSTPAAPPGLPAVPRCNQAPPRLAMNARLLGVLKPQEAPKGTYPAGSTVAVQASNLPANQPVNLLFSGPREQVVGTVANVVLYSALVGVAQTDASGHLNAMATLPANAAAGNGSILAYRAHCTRCGALGNWPVTTDFAAPTLEVHGSPGTQFVVNPDAALSATGACGGTLPAGGTTTIQVAPGLNTVSSQRPTGGPIGSTLGIYDSGSTSTLNVSNIFDNPCVSGPTQLTSVLDDLSGVASAATGDGPLGWFLTQETSVTDNIIVAASNHGHPPDSPPTIGVSLRDADGNEHQHVSVATRLDAGALTTFLEQAHQNLDNAHDSTIAAQMVAHNIVWELHIVPGDIPTAGEGSLHVDIGGCGADIPIGLAPSHWHTGAFNVADDEFDRASRTYVAYGSVPFNLPMWDNEPLAPNGLGWDAVGPIPAYHYHLLNRFIYGMFLGETFTTNGTWNGAGSLGFQAKLLGIDLTALIPPFNQHQQVDDLTIPSHTTTHGTPQDPQNQWGLGGDLAPQLQPVPNPPGYSMSPVTVLQIERELLSADIPVYAIPIPICGNVGFGVHIGFGADLQIGAGGSLTPDLTVGTASLVPAAGLFLSAGARISICAAVLLELGVRGDITFSFPITYDFSRSPSFGDAGHVANPDVYACISGLVHIYLKAAVHIWILDGSINIFDIPLLRFTAGDPRCPAPGGLTLRKSLQSAGGSPGRVARVHVQVASAPTDAVASPSLASDPSGREAAVWVRSANGTNSLVGALGAHGALGKQTVIARSPAGIVQPHVAALGNGRFLATWIGNTLTSRDAPRLNALLKAGKGTQVLAAYVRHQEVFSALFAGGRWSAPVRLTRDQWADGDPAIAADPQSGSAELVWTRAVAAGRQEVVARRWSGHAWSPLTTIASGRSLNPRSPSVTDSPNGYHVAWIAGGPGTGSVRVASLSGGHWMPASAPSFKGNVQSVSLTARASGLVLAAAVARSQGKSVSAAEPAIWTATLAGSHWTTHRITAQGTQPTVTSNGARAVLTYVRPRASDALYGPGDEMASVLGPSGRWSPSGALTHDHGRHTDPSAVLDGSRGGLIVLDQGGPAVGPASPAPTTTQLTSTARMLDTKAAVEVVSAPWRGQPVLDLGGAVLAKVHPAPGSSDTIRVSLRNTGLAPATAKGTVKVRSGTAGVASIRFHRSLAPGAQTIVSIPVTAPKGPMTLSASGLAVTAAVPLGLPVTPQNLTAAASPGGDVELQWSPTRDHDITGYNVYRRDAGGWTLVGMSANNGFVDSGEAKKGAVYAVTALDAQDRESLLSPSASETAPGQGPPQTGRSQATRTVKSSG